MEPIIFPTPEMVDGYVRASKLEELKKLKEEIEEIEKYYLYSMEDLIRKEDLFKAIDKRISELKGE